MFWLRYDGVLSEKVSQGLKKLLFHVDNTSKKNTRMFVVVTRYVIWYMKMYITADLHV